MVNRLIGLLLVITLSSFVGCTEDNNPSAPIDGGSYYFKDYVQFDTSQCYLFYCNYWQLSVPHGEPVFNWEKSFGEPFHDYNRNGIYEPGIDSFVIALDPAINQDINRNNRYDGPDDPWTQGIPFDDINSDGICNPYTGDFYTGYLPGMPFCDQNNNGIRDTAVAGIPAFKQWVQMDYGKSSGSLYRISGLEVTYRFVSDSGRTYEQSHRGAPLLNFPDLHVRDSGLCQRLTNVYLPIMDTGLMVEEIQREFNFLPLEDPPIYYRTIELGVPFSIGDHDFAELVKVQIIKNTDTYESFGKRPVWEYFFSKEFGLTVFGYGEMTVPPWVQDTLILLKYSYLSDTIIKNDSMIYPASR